LLEASLTCDFDEAFFSSQHIRNPIEPLAELRKRGSVHYSNHFQGWVTLGWEDSRTVLKSRAIGQGDRLAGYVLNLPTDAKARLHPISDNMDRAISFLDPPEHTPARAAAAQVLNSGLGRRIEPDLRAALALRIDELSTREVFDGIEDFALPITVTMLCSTLGVHHEDREAFVGWVERVFSYIGSPMNDSEHAEDCKDAYHSLSKYVKQLFEEAQTRNDPEPSSLIGLFVAPGAAHGLTDRDLMGMTVGMVQGGFETTTTLISNTIAMLLQDREQLARIQAEPSLIHTAIEEVLRLAPSLKIGARQALADVELSDGNIRAGETVIPVFISANRDPEVFADPDSFDVSRHPNPHLSFGFGTHFCLGGPLARMQARMAIEELFARFPNMEIASEELVWRPSALLRRRESVPVFTHGSN
jgi:cytochrome P450